MSKTEFNEVSMLHYRENDGWDCFTLSDTLDNALWPEFATKIEIALRKSGCDESLYRKNRTWSCTIDDDALVIKACENVMDVCEEYGIKYFSSDYCDIECDEETTNGDEKEVNEAYNKEMFVVNLQSQWKSVRKEIIELSRKLGDIQKQMKIRIDELEALSVPLELYSPDGGWSKEVSKWRKK